MGWLFLCIACAVAIFCTVQQMACLHSLQMNVSAVTYLSDTTQADADDITSESDCEHSSLSLLSASPLIFEGAILFSGLMLALLAPVQIFRLSLFSFRAILPPRLRVHLRFCVFRE
ncbi:TPA: copper resistance protein [Escherichia coli]